MRRANIKSEASRKSEESSSRGPTSGHEAVSIAPPEYGVDSVGHGVTGVSVLQRTATAPERSESVSEHRAEMPGPLEVQANSLRIPEDHSLERFELGRATGKEYHAKELTIKDLAGGRTMSGFSLPVTNAGGWWHTQVRFEKHGPNEEAQGMTAHPLGPDHPYGAEPEQKGYSAAKRALLEALTGHEYVAGHLLNHNLGGPGKRYNLTAITSSANRVHENDMESEVKKQVNTLGKFIFYEVTPIYKKKKLKEINSDFKAVIENNTDTAKLWKDVTKNTFDPDKDGDKLISYASELSCVWHDYGTSGTKGDGEAVTIQIPEPKKSRVSIQATATQQKTIKGKAGGGPKAFFDKSEVKGFEAMTHDKDVKPNVENRSFPWVKESDVAKDEFIKRLDKDYVAWGMELEKEVLREVVFNYISRKPRSYTDAKEFRQDLESFLVFKITEKNRFADVQVAADGWFEALSNFHTRRKDRATAHIKTFKALLRKLEGVGNEVEEDFYLEIDKEMATPLSANVQRIRIFETDQSQRAIDEFFFSSSVDRLNALSRAVKKKEQNEKMEQAMERENRKKKEEAEAKASRAEKKRKADEDLEFLAGLGTFKK